MTTQYGCAQVEVHETTVAAGEAAARCASAILLHAIGMRGHARILVATGNSQLAFIDALTRHTEIDWPRVHALHMDEYAGLNADHPASFRRWIKINFAEKLSLASVSYIDGDAPDLGVESARYGRLLLTEPIDVAFVGFGENGHIAFNDPPVAKFSDPCTVKVVALDDACRRQQVGEGHFPDIAAVPRRAVTVTCPGLFQAAHWICVVPEKRKANAVKAALEGPIAETCPASLARRHPSATIFLDSESASLLSH